MPDCKQIWQRNNTGNNPGNKRSGKALDRRMRNRNADNRKSILPELLIAGLLFTGMTVMRLFYINSHEIQGAGFYELCRIQIGTQMPQLEYGVGDLYAKLLYLLFWLFGNHMLYAAYLQMALQIASLVFFYFALRSLWGFIPALAAEAALLVFPEFLKSLTILNQENLLLFLLCVNLCLAAAVLSRTLRKQSTAGRYALVILVSGICAGLSAYLEKLYLAVPAALLLALLLMKRPKEAQGMQKRRLQLPVYLIGMGLGFGVCLLVKRQITGQQYAAVWAEYDRVQLSGEVFLSGSVMNYASALLLFFVFVAAAAAIVIYSYCEKAQILPEIKEEIQIQDIESFEKSETEEEIKKAEIEKAEIKKAEIKKSEIKKSEIEKMEIKESELKAVTGQENSRSVQEQLPQETAEEKKTVKYIENPLPLPKRHVKKEMDYGFEPDCDLMKYDVMVEENDDFDLP